MLDINNTNIQNLFAPLKASLIAAGASATDVNTFIRNVVGVINDAGGTYISTLLINEINDLASNGWTIDLASPNDSAAFTTPETKQMSFFVNWKDLSNTTNNSNDSDVLVSQLAYEIGHAEDPQITTAEYVDTTNKKSYNALGVGAEVAVLLLSEAKSGYNQLAVKNQGLDISLNISGKELFDEKNSNPQQALLLSAADAGIGGQTTTGVNFLTSYWNQLLSQSGLTSSNTDANVLWDMDSMYMAGSNLTSSGGMVFSQDSTSNAISMTINFANSGGDNGIVEFNGSVTSVWEKIRSAATEMPMYEDTNHPSIYGSYFSALMFYRYFSGDDLENVTYAPVGISPEKADFLKKAAQSW